MSAEVKAPAAPPRRLKVDKKGYDFYLDLLRKNSPFSLTRWGDGEWNCILGEKGANCDGHVYYPDMGAALAEVLRRGRPYYYGLLTCYRMTGTERVVAWAEQARISIPWVDGDVFLDACLAGNLKPVIDILRRRRLIYVGPPHLKKLESIGAFKLAGFVEVPLKNCWLERGRILREVSTLARSRRAQAIGFSDGMPAKVFIDDLFPSLGHAVTMIDFGSMFDPFVGVISRRYHRDQDWAKLISQNLGIQSRD